MYPKRWLRRLRQKGDRGRKGQAVVELAVLLPLFLVMIIGVVEVADSMNGYVTVVDAARDGARLGSKNLATDDQIKNLVVLETNRLRNATTTGDVTVTHPTVNGVAAVRVQACNTRTLMLHVPLVMPNSFTMCSTTTMRMLPPSGTPAPGPTNTPAPTNTPGPTNTPTRTNTPVPPTPTRTPTPCPWWMHC